MKRLIKNLLRWTAKNNCTWFFLKRVVALGDFLQRSRKGIREIDIPAGLKKRLFGKMTVLHGPFSGMKYPRLDSVGSTLYPKLLGSYERELQPALHEMRRREYSEIFDIGCAEGYYAVGLARIFKKAEVYAYDTDEKARRLCAEMACLNAVDSRIHITSECTAKDIGQLPVRQRGLLISDCEGYEKFLFTRSNVRHLKKCDCIIEVHDAIDITISEHLRSIFSKTHSIVSIKSIDDIEKARTYQYKELAASQLWEKKLLLAERREGIMEWFICTPRA